MNANNFNVLKELGHKDSQLVLNEVEKIATEFAYQRKDDYDKLVHMAQKGVSIQNEIPLEQFEREEFDLDGELRGKGTDVDFWESLEEDLKKQGVEFNHLAQKMTFRIFFWNECHRLRGAR